MVSILHIIPHFGGLTGAELHVFDLARIQKQEGHTVGIYATVRAQGPLIEETKSLGIKILDDLEKGWEIVHAHQAKSAMVGTLLDVPVIQTIHSELFPLLEYPVVNRNVVHYICIRPSIQEMVCAVVEKEMTSVIYNGIDPSHFFPIEYAKADKPTFLFVGANDYLRERVIKRLVERAEKGEHYLILVGKGHPKHRTNVISMDETREVDLITQRVDVTASVMMGRTTIEGFLCHKPGVVFTVDTEGHILNEEFLDVPEDLTPYTLTHMYEAVDDVYKLAGSLHRKNHGKTH